MQHTIEEKQHFKPSDIVTLEDTTKELLQLMICRGDGALEKIRSIGLPAFSGFNTGIDEVVLKFDVCLALFQRETEQLIKPGFELLRLMSEIDEGTGLVEGEMNFTIPVSDDTLKFYVRFSFVFIKKLDGWKVLSGHISCPKAEQAAGEGYPVDALKAQNEELEKLVTQRTEELKCSKEELEQKNHDLQIEAALENVRVRAMAMNSSDELKEVVKTLFEELTRLDVNLHRCMIWTPDPASLNSRVWVLNPETMQGESVMLPYNEDPFYQELLNGWKERNKNWIYTLDGEAYKNWVDFFCNRTEFSRMPEIVRASIQGLQKAIFWASNYDYGAIQVASVEPFSEDSLIILRRFSKEFDRIYTRFLDLQRAEAQAREAEIELSLERVRAKTMAMKHHTDLLQVTDIVFEQLMLLGFDLDVVNFSANGLSYGDWDLWITSPASESAKITVRVLIPWLDHPYFQQARIGLDNYFEKGIDLNVAVFSKEEKDNFLDHLFLNTKYKELVSEAARAFVYNKPGYTFSTISLKETWVAIGKYDTTPFTDEQHKVLRRFAVAFEQAYTRFLDLQKAEAQARDARHQASINRVRAEIASMRTTQDLERITPLIWRELTALGVPFIRCGVFIMDDAQEKVHTFLSTPEGKAIAAFKVSYYTPGNIPDIISHWQKKEIYTDHWDEKAFAEFAESLMKQGALASSEEYQNTMPKGGFYLQFFPFQQGMLYVGTHSELEHEEMKVVQSLADAFSTAYARYEDFNKLEVAKQQVELTLAELQATQAQLVQKEKMASLGELTAGIAHEIQNPLNFVNNFSDVNKELISEMKEEIVRCNFEEVKILASGIEENEEKISHHGRRADAIVKSMLQHTRASTGKKESVNINALVDEYIRLSYHGMRAIDKNFSTDIRTDFDRKIGKVSVVPQDIGRVLLNLFNNAFYAVNKKKESLGGNFETVVFVSTKKEGDKVVIRVKDNGTGIPLKVREKIFQPFFTTKPTGEGTGLGLSLSYDIITKGHGGEIRVQTNEGEGAEFIIQLPFKTKV